MSNLRSKIRTPNARPKHIPVVPPKPTLNIFDYAQRAVSISMAGLTIWGIWLVGSILYSRRNGQLPPSVLERKRQEELKKQEESLRETPKPPT